MGSDFASSGYSMSSIDPSTSTMTMGVLGTSLSDDYAVTADLANSDMSAIDSAELAVQARLLEEARRAALASQRDKAKLKSGSVPAQYEPLVLDAVSNFCPQLSPAILAAQIEAESNWNPTATSPVGASGIAQFMPGTWATHGVDGNGDGTKNVLDPADAIPAAAKYDCSVRDTVRKVPGDPDSNMLAGYNAGPGAVLKYRGIPPYAETQSYVSKILSRASEMTDYEEGSSGEAGTSAGCPTRAPAGTLRDGARKFSIEQICADSVAQARSPEAARAIKYALRNLGAPYSQPNRMKEFSFDCSSLVARAYHSAGLTKTLPNNWAPTTYALAAAPYTQDISFESRRPGDIMYPFAGHVTMSLAHGLKVHTNRPGDVAHVNDVYGKQWKTQMILPEKGR
jgi:cell wall-associated NlpC family hydrolase